MFYELLVNNVSLPIYFGFGNLLVLLFFNKTRLKSLETVINIFFQGGILYGAASCFWYGITGRFFLGENLGAYRIYIALAGLVLLYQFIKLMRKHLKKHKGGKNNANAKERRVH